MKRTRFTMWAMLIVVLAIGTAATQGCAALQRSGIADRLADVAGRVCLERDSLEVCASKCEAEIAGDVQTSAQAGGGGGRR